MTMGGPLLRTMSQPAVSAEVGGKAAGLYRLVELGLPVPPFVVLTAAAYRLAAGGAEPIALPAEVEDALDAAWQELGGGEMALAARSSAIDEDGAERSFAGQMETRLNVVERTALSAAVLDCWRSLYGERARAYRAAETGRGASSSAEREPQGDEATAAESPGGSGLAMAVVLQRMVTPDSSGVLFTVNPASGRADEILVSSVWGLGEGLVSGALDADTFVLDRAGRVLTCESAEKTERFVASSSGGVERRAVAADRIHAMSLDATVLAALANHSLEAERRFGRPLDIEFAVAAGELLFLQARPVTAFVHRAAPADGNRQVWDNSNIVESYPGITQPLTFSFIRRAYHAVYRQFCEVLGLRQEEIRRNDHMLGNMLGLIRGRVYYNLLNWYRLVALLPGFRFNRRFMEGMMGVAAESRVEEPATSFRQRYLEALPQLVRTGFRAVWLQTTLERRIAGFQEEFAAAHSRFAAIDYAGLPPAEVLAHYRRMEQEVLWRWKAPIVNDFSVMIFYGLLKKLTVDWGLDPDGSLANALVSHQGDIESTEVADRLRQLARSIGEEPELASRFASASPAEALALLEAHAELGPRFAAYLDRFGDRSIAELKLESRSTRDDPTLCLGMLQSYLDLPADPDSAATQAQEKGRVREEAEAALARGLAGLHRLPKRWIYRWVLRRARVGIRNRENQRLARTRAFAVARSMFRSVGASFGRLGLLEHAEDVFFLRLEEMMDVVDGAAVTPDLKAPVRRRRAAYERFAAEPPPPDHLETWGPAAAAASAGELVEAELEAEAGTEGVLSGLGAFPGVVEQRAAVVFEPDATLRLRGAILVTRQTDPGWVVLFPSISGLVVERGSMLSHSAIVAREMGIPAVVGVRGATLRIGSGDLLRLDGARGRVAVLERAAGKDA